MMTKSVVKKIAVVLAITFGGGLGSSAATAFLIPQETTISPLRRQQQLRIIVVAPSTTTNIITHQRSPLKLASSSSSSDDNDKKTKNNTGDGDAEIRALGTIQIPTLVGCLLSGILIQRVLTTTTSRLFQQHVIGASLGGLVFLPAALGAAQSRVRHVQQQQTKKDASNGKKKTGRQLLIQHIYTHFYLTYGAAICAVVSIGSIFYNKMVNQKPHFTSLHSRLAFLTTTVWGIAYLIAQKKVWTPILKTRDIKVGPKILFASQNHRRLGLLATLGVQCTIVTGIAFTQWGRSIAFSSTITRLGVVATILASQTYFLIIRRK